MNMNVSSAGSKITSKVRGRDVRVTPDSIASYLNYTRPQVGNSEYPQEDYPSLTEAEYAQAVYERPDEFRAGDKFQLGKFKGSYKLMTKVIHYNIAPIGSKKQLNLMLNFYM